jgi:O-antigen ligase
VMALTLPFALYLALSARSLVGRAWFAGCSVLVAVGLVISISRTGVVATAVMLFIALVVNARRPRMVVAVLVAVAGLAVVVASLAPRSVDATFEQLGKNRYEDSSLATRLEDYEELENLLGPHPWLGRGLGAIGTYVARDGGGIILDNQYLLSIAETGVLGAAALIVLLVSSATNAARRLRAGAERGLWVAALCGIGTFGAVCALFDTMRFSQVTAVFMIIVGLVSAADRPVETAGAVARNSGSAPPPLVGLGVGHRG